MCILSHSVMSNSCDPLDGSPPDSSIHGIFLERILGWVAISSSWVSSQPRDQTSLASISVSCVSCIGRWILNHLRHLGSTKLYINRFQSMFDSPELHPCTILDITYPRVKQGPQASIRSGHLLYSHISFYFILSALH